MRAGFRESRIVHEGVLKERTDILLEGVVDVGEARVHHPPQMVGQVLADRERRAVGAAGALEAVACLQSIATGRVHPTINHDDPEDGVDFDVVANEAQDFRVKVALSNSFGFGGTNASLIVGEVT